MTLEELALALERLEDVTHAQAGPLVSHEDPAVRLAARTALARTAIRTALGRLGELAREQRYGDQGTLTAIQRLASVSDWDEPYVETLKQLGIQAAAKGEVNAAMQYLQEAVFRGFSSGQRRDERSRRSMRYAHDAEIDAAIERLAQAFTPPAFGPPGEPLKLAVLCTALADEDGPTVLTVKRVEYFKDEGFDVQIVSTELGSSANTKMAARVAAMGIPFAAAPHGAWDERMRWLIAHFTAHPADMLVYMTSAQDNLAKLAGCVGLAPVQSWDVRALEPQSGKWDLMNHCVSPDQETQTRWPGIARFTGRCHALAEEIAAAVPFARSELGVPGEAILLATFGRVEKANSHPYLNATAQILGASPNAILLFAGPDSQNVYPAMQQFYAARGVDDRVRYLGRRQQDGPRLLKTVDVYCETYPWPGGQSLLDAMEAQLPIVAMKRAPDTDLDPTGTGATSSIAEEYLGDVVQLAPAGDVEAYVRIALQYIRDPQLRAAHGALLREKVRRVCDLRAATALYGKYLREIAAEKAAALS